jgi:hypothetical protein
VTGVQTCALPISSLSYFYVMAYDAEEAAELFGQEYTAMMESDGYEVAEEDIYVDAIILAPDGVAVEYTG